MSDTGCVYYSTELAHVFLENNFFAYQQLEAEVEVSAVRDVHVPGVVDLDHIVQDSADDPMVLRLTSEVVGHKRASEVGDMREEDAVLRGEEADILGCIELDNRIHRKRQGRNPFYDPVSPGIVDVASLRQDSVVHRRVRYLIAVARAPVFLMGIRCCCLLVRADIRSRSDHRLEPSVEDGSACLATASRASVHYCGLQLRHPRELAHESVDSALGSWREDGQEGGTKHGGVMDTYLVMPY